MRGSVLRSVKSLADIRDALRAGPDEYSTASAARVLGVHVQTLCDWRDAGRVASMRNGRGYTFTRDALWALALDVHGVNVRELDSSDDTRSAVLRMLERWSGCPTIQELHDAAGILPLPPICYDHSTRKPPDMEDVTCACCGAVFSRPIDSDARWSLCRPCTSRVRQRSARLAQEYVTWCRRG